MALIRAASKGDIKRVEMLLDQKVNIDDQNILGNTALHMAARNDRLKVVLLLLDRGARTDITNKLGNTPLHSVLTQYKGKHCNYDVKNTQEIIFWLERHGAKINALNNERQTPFYCALWFEVDVLETLKKLGAHTKNSPGIRCIPETSYRKVVEKIGPDGAWFPPLLLEKQKALNEAFMHAAKRGDEKQVKIFLDKGADIDYQDLCGNTSLHLAALFDCVEVVSLLLMQQAKIDIQNEEGNTALHSVCAPFKGKSYNYGDVAKTKEIITLLIAKGADVGALNDENQTPYDCAVAFEMDDVLEAFEELVWTNSDLEIEYASKMVVTNKGGGVGCLIL